MFLVTETDAAAIRDVFEKEGDCRPPSNDGFRASPTTLARGNAFGPSEDGNRRRCPEVPRWSWLRRTF
jgi:hypothetical protein